MTGSRVMTIFVYKGLTRNPEIGNTLVWVLPNIWRLRQVRDTKFGTTVSNKKFSNTSKCQGYSFYRFWVIKGKPAGGVKLPPFTQIRVKENHTLTGLTHTSLKLMPFSFFVNKYWNFEFFCKQNYIWAGKSITLKQEGCALRLVVR